MDQKSLNYIAAFDIENGRACDVDDAWPKDVGGASYRWIHLDLTAPNLEEWASEHLPDIAARSLLQSETRPRCEKFEDGLILNLRGVNLNPGSDPEDMVSLRMWVTDKSIVSARMRKVWAVDAIRTTALEGTAPKTVGRFLADLTFGLTTRIETVSLDLEDQTDELEEAVWEGKPLPAGRLVDLRQAIIKMRRFVNPQRDAIEALAAMDGWIIAPKELALLRETANRTRRIVEELDATRDRLSALQDHIEASRALALSQNSYLLSIVAAIFLPLSFLSGLFGVNLGGMPGAASELAFWLLATASVLIGLILLVIFKFKKWF